MRQIYDGALINVADLFQELSSFNVGAVHRFDVHPEYGKSAVVDFYEEASDSDFKNVREAMESRGLKLKRLIDGGFVYKK